jgi:heptosyltransferase-3
MRILILKFRNIGDVLLSTSLLENLKLNYTNAKIDYALNDSCSEMIRLNTNINNLFEYNRDKIKKQNFFLQIIEEIKYIKNIIKNDYDIIINLTEGDRGSLISLLCKSKIKLGYKPKKDILKLIKIYTKEGIENQKIHSVEKDLQFIKLLDKNIIHKKISIYWSKNDKKEIDTILDNNKISSFVHIHPVARWMFKCWDDNKMAQVIDYIQKNKKTKVIITSSSDKIELDRVNSILTLCKTKPINLSGELSLKKLACLSSKAKLFFGVDTAPMHIAAAVECPVIGLFGASFPHIWGPWSNGSKITNFKFINGTQKSGIHSMISNTNHTIYYENEIKKFQGMTNIKFDEVKILLDTYLKKDENEN